MEVAARQHGQVSLEQALKAGLTERVIERRVADGWWQRPHEGVLSFGPSLTPESRWMAAVLACGGPAMLGWGAASGLWGFGSRDAVAEIVVPFGRARGPVTVRTHETRRLKAADRRVWRAIPVTSPARTLVDRAGQITKGVLERELHEAQVLRLVTPAEVRAALDRAGRRRGAATLRALLDDAVAGPTRSELEREFSRLMRRGKLSPYQRNVTLRLADRVIQADAYWPEARLVVELDGRHVHGTAYARSRDEDRDLDVALDDLLPIRLDWRLVVTEGATTAERLRRLITQRGAGRNRH